MNIFKIISLLLIGIECAKSAVQTISIQSKPACLYLKSFSLNQNGSGSAQGVWSGSPFVSSFDYSFTTSYQGSNSLTYLGNSYAIDTSKPILVEQIGPHESIQTYEGQTEEIGSGYVNDGIMVSNIETGSNTFQAWEAPEFSYTNTFTNLNVNVPIVWENASFAANENIAGNQESIGRYVVTILKLKTSGKTASISRNLFQLSAIATRVAPPFIPNNIFSWYDPLDIYDNHSITNGGTIPPQGISMGSYGQLGSDGNLFKDLPDNDDIVVTPTTSANDYTFSAEEQKYRAFIQANNAILYPNQVGPSANFCVGQGIGFEITWSPYSPAGGSQVGPVQWGFDGTFVNTNVPPDNYLETDYYNYQEDPDFLQGETVSNWWVSGSFNPPTYNARVAEYLTFANGQQALVNAQGQFTMFRPKISGFATNGPYYAVLSPSNSPSELSLGQGFGSMDYYFKVKSVAPFSGSANIVQLANVSDSDTPSFNGTFTTDGQFDLDTAYLYLDTDVPLNAQYGYENPGEFSDEPDYGLGGSLCSIVNYFQDYIVFKPTGNNSIYVTLGTVSWSWSASSSKNNGVWSNPTYNVTGPSTPDSSDEFPVWMYTVTGTW